MNKSTCIEKRTLFFFESFQMSKRYILLTYGRCEIQILCSQTTVSTAVMTVSFKEASLDVRDERDVLVPGSDGGRYRPRRAHRRLAVGDEYADVGRLRPVR